MAAQIRWNAGSGARTLAALTSIGRFNGWKVLPDRKGERAEGWGDGQGYQWAGRTDRVASMRLICAGDDQDLIEEFVAWANAFGGFAIDTGDSASRSYENCQIGNRVPVDASEPDPQTLDITLTLTVLNLDGDPMLCVY